VAKNQLELAIKIGGKVDKSLKTSTEAAKKELKSLGSTGSTALSTLGNAASTTASAVVGAGQVIAAGLAVAGGAIIAIGKEAIEAYAEYEQLVGGVETLFGAGGKSLQEYADSLGKTVGEVQAEYEALMQAQNTVMNDAAEAYKTAGMSANEYMETVTSFSASLIQSLGGDTVLAAE